MQRDNGCLGNWFFIRGSFPHFPGHCAQHRAIRDHLTFCLVRHYSNPVHLDVPL